MRIFIFFLTLLVLNPVFAIPGPAEQTQNMIKTLKQVKKNDEATYKKVDAYIDYHTITYESIAPHRSKFSDQQAKEFSRLFESLIRLVAYPQSSSFYEEAQSEFHKPIIKKNIAIVNSDAVIEKEDFEMEIGYQWKKNGDQWQLSDLIIDEDSLVKDYQNQFGRIIAKEGVEGLIKKVKDKIAEVKAEK